MTSVYHGRIVDANQKDKKDFALVWDGQIQVPDMWAIVEGGKDVELGPGICPLRHWHPATGRPGQVHPLRPGTYLVGRQDPGLQPQQGLAA
jgi:hypothetical protein